MENKIRFEVTMGRLCLLGLTSLMVFVMYGLALWSPSAAQVSPGGKESVSLPLKSTPQVRSQPSKVAEINSLPYSEGDVKAIVAKTVGELQSVFKKHDFTLSACQISGCVQVPRVELLSLPQDLKTLESPLKKDLFLRSHLPMILKANEAILEERERLQAIMRQTQEGQGAISAQDKTWIHSMMDKYRLKRWDLKELLVRIDVLPPSLALGQSAVESGWGTSFAAREKNSTFGMTVRNKVLGYNTLQDCVDAYIRNINANPAYRELRAIRARLRAQGTNICSMALTEGLVRYSELGQRYIKKVQVIIESNNLKRFDTAQLTTSSSEKA